MSPCKLWRLEQDDRIQVERPGRCELLSWRRRSVWSPAYEVRARRRHDLVFVVSCGGIERIGSPTMSSGKQTEASVSPSHGAKAKWLVSIRTGSSSFDCMSLGMTCASVLNCVKCRMQDAMKIANKMPSDVWWWLLRAVLDVCLGVHSNTFWDWFLWTGLSAVHQRILVLNWTAKAHRIRRSDQFTFTYPRNGGNRAKAPRSEPPPLYRVPTQDALW